MGLEDHSNLYQPQKNSLLDTRMQPDQLEETVYSYLELESNTDHKVKPEEHARDQLKQERAKTQQQASQLQSLQAQVDSLTKKWQATEHLLSTFTAATGTKHSGIQADMQKQLSTNMDLIQNLGAELESKEKTI